MDQNNTIGASLSEPQGRELNGDFCNRPCYRTSFRKCKLTLLTRNIAHAEIQVRTRNIKINTWSNTCVSVITLRQSEKVMNDQEPRRESRGRETPQQREQRLAQKTVMLHLFASRQSTRIQQLQTGSFVTGCRSLWMPSTLKLARTLQTSLLLLSPDTQRKSTVFNS